MINILINSIKKAIEQHEIQNRINTLIGKKKKSDYVRVKIPKKYILMIETLAKLGINDNEELYKIINSNWPGIPGEKSNTIHMKTGIELIAQERAEQIEKHGRTVEKDVIENGFNQLKSSAIMLLNGYLLQDEENYTPFNWDEEIWQHMLSKPIKERLIIAGALIAAEIDRLQAS